MPEDLSRVFFGYPSKPETQRDAISTAAARLNSASVARATTWESLAVNGRVIVDRITEAIDSSALAAFDVTNLNQNVLFELGYAIGKERRVWILRDTSIMAYQRKWSQLGLLSTVGFTRFTSSDDVVHAFSNDKPHLSDRSLYDDLIRPSLGRTGTPSVFVIPSRHNTEANRRIVTRVRQERTYGLRIATADPVESPSDTLAWYAQEVLSAAAVIVHFTSLDREFADIHNARAALIAGLALGMGRKVLMLAEADFFAPIDFRDLLYRYANARICGQKTDEWLANTLTIARQQLSHPALPVRPATALRELRLGSHVAENEEDSLAKYFVPTVSFEEVLAGKAAVFVGRRGAGKTANLFQAAKVLAEDPRNLVCVIKPVGYEWESLLRLMEKYPTKDAREYLLNALWTFLLESEIANALAAEARARPAGLVFGTADWNLVKFLETEAPYVNDDFAIRLERAIKALVDAPAQSDDVGAERGRIAAALDMGVSNKLRQLLGEALHQRDRVAILVDNLDEPWEEGADVDLLSRFLLALLACVTRLPAEFAKSYGWRRSVNVTVSAFIRADIFSELVKVAREPDKIPVTRLAWDSPEMLLRVIEERYLAAKGGEGEGAQLWDQYFTPMVGQQPTSEYIASRVLPRPRDIVFLCNAAITAALNKRHQIVEAVDIRDAERDYSRFAYDAIQVEDEVVNARIEDVILEFVGAKPVLSRAAIFQFFASAGVSEADFAGVLGRLREASFLGIETADDSFSYSDDPTKMAIADRLAARRPEPRFKIHAAFRPYLDITDHRVDGALS